MDRPPHESVPLTVAWAALVVLNAFVTFLHAYQGSWVGVFSFLLMIGCGWRMFHHWPKTDEYYGDI